MCAWVCGQIVDKLFRNGFEFCALCQFHESDYSSVLVLAFGLVSPCFLLCVLSISLRKLREREMRQIKRSVQAKFVMHILCHSAEWLGGGGQGKRRRNLRFFVNYSSIELLFINEDDLFMAFITWVKFPVLGKFIHILIYPNTKFNKRFLFNLNVYALIIPNILKQVKETSLIIVYFNWVNLPLLCTVRKLNI